MDNDALENAIQAARSGHPASIEVIVRHYANRIFGFLYRMTGSRPDAEDLMQEVFVRLVGTVGTYEHRGRFEPWLFRIAANLARDRLRRIRRSPRWIRSDGGADGVGGAYGGGPSLEEMAISNERSDASLIRTEEIDALGAAIGQLPEPEREVIMLRHFSQLSFREIAESTGVPLGTALARGHRGLKHLRRLMTEPQERSGVAKQAAAFGHGK
jgi:RNA polymerase sigma-70 factor (ECF subfamily)